MIKILGTGSCVPEYVLDNAALSKMVDTSDEWITTRTGIKTRRVLTHETQIDLAAKAGQNALGAAGLSAADVDLILCATFHSYYKSPSLACMVSAKIGANAPALDINAACSGFVYGLQVASAYLQSGLAKRVLLIAAEALSQITDYTDRATCVLFGDGAGAVVLEKGRELKSLIVTAKGDAANLVVHNSHGNFPLSDKPDDGGPFLRMNGQEIYKFAVNAIMRDMNAVLEKAGIQASDVDYLLLHQANLRIIQAAQERLKLPPEKLLTNIERYGNTSAACIPLLLDEGFRTGKIKSGNTLLLSAFGAGLTTGAAVIKIS